MRTSIRLELQNAQETYLLNRKKTLEIQFSQKIDKRRKWRRPALHSHKWEEEVSEKVFNLCLLDKKLDFGMMQELEKVHN
jgi:hypothetical protein